MDFTVLILCILHVLFWTVILLGPLFAPLSTVYVIGLVLVPLTVVSHAVLPNCLLQHGKCMVAESEEKALEMSDDFTRRFIPLNWFTIVQTKLEENCFQSPLSPQGMLIISLFLCMIRISLAPCQIVT